jgi:hypothetical protein
MLHEIFFLRFWRNGSCAIGGLSIIFALLICSPVSAQCLRDARDVKFADGSAKLRSYRCKTGNETDAAQVTIEFHRLSEAAAGNLLKGESYPELDAVFGKPRIVKTAVGDEATLLFDRFGTRQKVANCYKFRADVPAGLPGYTPGNMGDDRPKGHACGERVLRFLSFPDQEGLTASDLPQPRDNKIIRTSAGWPAGYRFHYEACTPDQNIFECSRLWRYMTAADIRDFDSNMRAAQREVGGNDGLSVKNKKYFGLISHVTRSGWAEDFMTTVGSYSVCGGGYDFAYHPRQLVLEVALIQNASGAAISLDGLLGTTVTAGLRRNALPSAQGGPIAIAKTTIGPNQRVLVPLRISFVSPPSLVSLFAKPADARATYQRIQNLAPGTIISEPAQSGQAAIRKARESFGPPQAPAIGPYIYGPEIGFKGIVVNGKPVMPDDVSRNFLELTAGEGYGSCPFLYAWDSGSSEWVRYGKVIHQATDKSKEMTEEVKLHAFTTRIRLTEEELELSYIDRVALKLDMKDGSILMLKPILRTLQNKDGQYFKIYAGQKLDIDFDAPKWLDRDAVASTHVVITGYYERYTAIEARNQ